MVRFCHKLKIARSAEHIVQVCLSSYHDTIHIVDPTQFSFKNIQKGIKRQKRRSAMCCRNVYFDEISDE